MFAMHSNVDAVVLDGDDWREIDRALRSIAKRQRALDAEEAALLCVVVRQQIWRELGCATMLEYLELIFGYGPKVGHERVRVAMALETLPELREALASGDLSYSALRELTRVVTPNTQQAWLDAVRGKSVRQIEDLVRTHRKGDLPTDPGDPDLKPRRLQFEVSKATEALLRQARQVLANERGRFIEDDEFLATMAASLLEGGSGESDHGRARYQVRVTTCDCLQTYFEGGGRKIAVADVDAARAECDAQRLGADQLATQDIAPKTRREVLHRDGGKCTVPRCRSARFIELHHIVPRSEGGSHDASNVTTVCFAHHQSLHDGKLVLSGAAPNISVRFIHDPHVETPARATHVEARHIDPKLATKPPHGATSMFVETHVRAAAIPDAETNLPTDASAVAIPHVETSTLVEIVEPNLPTDASAVAIPHVETSTLVEIVEPNPQAAIHVKTSKLVELVEPNLPTDERAVVPHVETSMLVEIVERKLPTDERSAAAIPHVEMTVAHTTPRDETSLAAHADSLISTDDKARLEPSVYSIAEMTAEAKQALRQLGFSPTITTKCVDSAVASQPTPTTLEQLIRVALKYSR